MAKHSTGQAAAGGVALSDADRYTRKSVQMTEEGLRMMELARKQIDQRQAEQERLQQADADFRQRMARMTGPTAIKWREEDRRAQQAQAWLDQQQGEEQRRFDHRTRCRTKCGLERGRYLEWKHYHPEPPQRLWNRRQREAWEQERDKVRAPLEAAHNAYQHAKANADAPALNALEQEREKRERERARAVANRQTLGLLPSEEHAQKEQQRLAFKTRPEAQEIEPPAIHGATRSTANTPLSRGFHPPRR